MKALIRVTTYKIAVIVSGCMHLVNDPIPFTGYRIQRTWESGLNNYWYDSYKPPGQNCRIDYRPKTRNKPLTLIDLSSVFLLFGLGIALSVLAFLIERIVATWKQHNQPEIPFWNPLPVPLPKSTLIGQQETQLSREKPRHCSQLYRCPQPNNHDPFPKSRNCLLAVSRSMIEIRQQWFASNEKNRTNVTVSVSSHTHTHTHKRAWCFHFNLSTIKTNFEEYNLLFNVDILKDVWRVHKFSFGRHRKSIDVLIFASKSVDRCWFERDFNHVNLRKSNGTSQH